MVTYAFSLQQNCGFPERSPQDWFILMHPKHLSYIFNRHLRGSHWSCTRLQWGITFHSFCHWAAASHGPLEAPDNTETIPEIIPTVQSSHLVKSRNPKALPCLQADLQTELTFELLNTTADCINSNLDRNTFNQNWACKKFFQQSLKTGIQKGKCHHLMIEGIPLLWLWFWI